MRYEIKKVIKNPIMTLIIGLVLVISIFLTVYEKLDTRLEIVDKGKRITLTGADALDYKSKNIKRMTLDDKFVKSIFKKYDGKSYDFVDKEFRKNDPALLSLLFSIYREEMFNEDQILDISRISTFNPGEKNRKDTILELESSGYYNKKEIAEASKKLGKINQKLEHGFTDHFDSFIRSSFIVYLFLAFLSIAISIYLFSIEESLGTDLILSTIKNKAKSKIAKDKTLALFLIITAIYLLITLLMLIVTVLPYGFKNYDIMIQSSISMIKSNMDFSYAELLLVTIAINYLSIISLSLFAGFFTKKFKSSKLSLLIMVFAVGIVFFKEITPLTDRIFAILPQAGLFAPSYLFNYYNYSIFGLEFNSLQLIIITNLLLIFVSILAPRAIGDVQNWHSKVR